MFWKKGVFILFISIFLIPSAFAAEFLAEAIPINDSIYPEQSAIFDLRIINNIQLNDEYRVYTLDYPLWSIYSEPGIYSVTAAVPGRSKETVRIHLEPVNAKPGVHAVNIRVRSKVLDEVINVPATVTLRHYPGSKEYVPTVIMDIDMPEDIIPSEPIPIKIHLSNQNPLDIPEMVIMISSENGLITKTIPSGISPKEKKTVEITETLDLTTAPQPEILYFTLLRGNETITGPKRVNIEIVEYSDVVPDEETIMRFLRTDKNIEFQNIGNIDYDGIVKTETTFIRKLFTSTSPSARGMKEEGQRYLSWEVSLGPGEIFEARVVVNYRPLVLIIILSGIAVLLYFQFRSPVIIKKSHSNIHKHEGGIAGVRVMINVTNRGKTSVKDVHLTERIPHLVDVEHELTLGSLHPNKMLKHEKKGMLLKWDIDELEPGEERVITYKIRTKLSILGEFMLPPMTARFKFMGREMKSHSNRLYMNS